MRIKMKIGTKALLFISLVTFLIFSASIGYIALKANKLALNNAKELADSYAREYANEVKANLNVDMISARAIAEAFKGYKEVPYESRATIYTDILRNIAIENPNFLSVWANWELQAINKDYFKPFGRARFTIYRDANGNILYYSDTLDLEGDNINSAYYKMKVSKLETVMEPYKFSYTGSEGDQILETSVCSPILDNGKFVGLAGIDLSLDRFDKIISNIHPFEGSDAFLNSNLGVIISHSNNDYEGKSIKEVFPQLEKKFKITEKIQKGRDFSFRTDDNRYVSFAPLTIGNTVTPWSLAIEVPISIIIEKAKRHLKISIIVGIVGLIILAVFIWFITLNISKPLQETTEVVKNLSKGDIDEKRKLNIKSGDEIEEIADSVNALVNGLNSTARFASEIGKGNLEAEFHLLSEKDVLGNSLLEMRKSLIAAREEEKNRKIEDEKQNWTTQGMNKFSDILRQNNDNIKELSFQIMSNLINYIEANQGAIFVANKTEENDEVEFELTSAIAYGRDRLVEKKIKLGDGLVGRCAFEQLTIYMVDVPEDYVNITSGLGKSNPRCILLVPLKLNDEVYGVIELISFEEFKQHQIEFVEQLGTSIASTISTVKVNEKTAKLLEQSQKQAEELASQEEEMRQNLEELQATQEEASRREAEMGGLLKALNENLLVIEMDMEGHILTINESFCQLIGMSMEQLIGRKHLELPFLSDEDIRHYSDLWVYFKDGISKREIIKLTINDKELWLSETFTPIFDIEGKPYKVLNMALNITKSKQAELKYEKLEKELKANNETLLVKDKELKISIERYKEAEQKFNELQKIHQDKIRSLQNNFEKQLRKTRENIEKKLNEELLKKQEELEKALNELSKLKG
ncbi:MAG: GAF domain-containing protein [Chlorobi bacterium]|nr:GAF domain-containing protein [Chlorobiota bacterium]